MAIFNSYVSLPEGIFHHMSMIVYVHPYERLMTIFEDVRTIQLLTSSHIFSFQNQTCFVGEPEKEKTEIDWFSLLGENMCIWVKTLVPKRYPKS